MLDNSIFRARTKSSRRSSKLQKRKFRSRRNKIVIKKCAQIRPNFKRDVTACSGHAHTPNFLGFLSGPLSSIRCIRQRSSPTHGHGGGVCIVGCCWFRTRCPTKRGAASCYHWIQRARFQTRTRGATSCRCCCCDNPLCCFRSLRSRAPRGEDRKR